MRLDRALVVDLRTASRSRPIFLFLVLQVLAGVTFVARRGEGTVSTVLLIWLGMLILAFFAWWAGRHRRAVPAPDPVPGAPAKAIFALLAAAGMLAFSLEATRGLGLVLFACGLGGWLWAAIRGHVQDGSGGLRQRLTRDPRPFVPFLTLIGLPRLVLGGPGFLLATLLALPSGIGQQLLFLVGLFAPLEASLRRSDAAAVLAALVFGLVHWPLVLEPNQGDLVAGLANVVLFQSSVGLVACLAYIRHRAVVPIGVVHALAIA